VKRGPLDNVRVLLGADSFTDLLNRYRYLYLFASLDRALVDTVAALETSLVMQNQEMAAQVADLERLRESKLQETQEFELVRTTRQNALQSFRVEEERTEGRLAELEANMVRMTSTVSRLEQQRRSDEQRDRIAGAPAPGPSTISTSDAGALAWPVEGEVIYPFGRSVQPNGTVLRWNGIGISAPAGTPVRAVRPGLVVLAGQFEGYGPTVVLSHGNGFYTLYLYLQDLRVVEGRTVSEGQIVGTVGGVGTPEGPHIEFQVRAPLGGGTPEAQDPIMWLKAHGGT
jgi:septal ring factor EnvC (AmiA/AmiB activator)